jgi:hypothetical protein
MPSIQGLKDLVSRDTSSGTMTTSTTPPAEGGNDNMLNLSISILGLVFFALLLISILFLLRRTKRNRMMMMKGHVLPTYEVKGPHNHHGLTIQTAQNGRSSILVISSKDGQPMLADPMSPPHSPKNVPQIHITFPDEQDEHGHNKSGRVLVVRMGDSTVGLEPVKEEQLPAYEKEGKNQFYSIDMNQIGGLREKERSTFH